MADPASCPTGITLPQSIDLVWSDRAAVHVVGDQVHLGAVQSIACGQVAAGYLLDNLKPGTGAGDLYLARVAGSPDYGVDSAGRPRVADSGDCR